MARAFHALLVACVLFAGLHFGDEALAHESGLEHAAHAVDDVERADVDRAGEGHTDGGDLAHGPHHHCPLATEQAAMNPAVVARANGDVHCRAPASLRSRDWPPLLEPPSA